VINLSSLAGLAGYPAGTAYSSSKWAVEGFSESLHYELLPFGIPVCVVTLEKEKRNGGAA
jgi:NAD(P)-dependent dehydrogenase (short-subunit alcohol dehydrogenase family)